MKPGDWKALLALLAMACLFGASFPATKVALGSFTPSQLIFLRFFLSSLCFMTVWIWIPRQRLSRGDLARIFAMALLEPGLYFYAEAEGIKRTLASTAAILIAAIPLFVLVLEALWLKVRVRAAEVALILVSLGGIYLLVAGGAGSAFGGTAVGNGLVLLAAIAASFYTVLARKLLTRISALTLTFYQSAFAAAFYLPLALFDTWRGAGPSVTRQGVLSLVYLGLFCSFVAYSLLNFCLGRMKASFVAAFTNVIPVVATAVAFFALDERLVVLQLVGGAVVLASMTTLTCIAPKVAEETATLER